jgi:large subunit ribosomal protein L4
MTVNAVKENKKLVLPLFSPQGEQVGEIAAQEAIFGVEVKPHLLHVAVEAYLANQRQGNASTKTRGEVHGSARKLFRQKGTGRARMGTARSPMRVGGGIAMGPRPHDFRQRLSQKARHQALLSALSSRVAAGEIKVLDTLPLEEISTKAMAELLKALGLTAALESDKAVVLLITDEGNEILQKSARNIPGLNLSRAVDLNTYEVLRHRLLLFTKEGLNRVQEALA